MTTDSSVSPPDPGDETVDETDEHGDRDDDGAVEESDATVDAKAPRQRKHLPVWQESILLLGVALGLAILIKTIFVQAFYIPSESMEPGLIMDDRILVQKVSYWFGGDPERGDVVVFEDPGEWLASTDVKEPEGFANILSAIGLYPEGGHLVKRVVGTEGDVIECCDDEGRILVNGEPIDESDYLADAPGKCNAVLMGGCDWSVGPVPDGKLFVLGDNRGQSADSRAHMCAPKIESCAKSPWVDEDLVVGRVFSLVWPRERWSWISRPEAFDDVPDSPPGD